MTAAIYNKEITEVISDNLRKGVNKIYFARLLL